MGAAAGAGGRTGVYPGSFDPPTVAHLAVARAAADQAGLVRVDLVISEVALGKARQRGPSATQRVAVLAEVARSRPWMGARLTGAQLLVDIAEGYDVLVLGADKWAQLVDPAWYGGSVQARDEVLARVPPILVAPRGPVTLPPPDHPRLAVLKVEDTHATVSSSAVRAGRREWMLAEAAATGWWGTPTAGPGPGNVPAMPGRTEAGS